MLGSRKYVLFGATLILALSLAPAAGAKNYLDRAKFKLLSLSGNTTLTWTEDSTAFGDRCAGTTISRTSVQSTERPTLYVFLKEFHGTRTIVAPDPDFRNTDSVELAGQGRISRSVNYQDTSGCDEYRPPEDCPEATTTARVTGTVDDPRGGIGWIVEDRWPPGYPDSCTILDFDFPFGVTRFEHPTNFAHAIPLKDLFNEKKGRLSATVSTEETLAQEPNSSGGTVTAYLTDQLSVRLKRLEFTKSEKRG